MLGEMERSMQSMIMQVGTNVAFLLQIKDSRKRCKRLTLMQFGTMLFNDAICQRASLHSLEFNLLPRY
jgi:hypothetical protein